MIGFVVGVVCGVIAMGIAIGFWLYDTWTRS